MLTKISDLLASWGWGALVVPLAILALLYKVFAKPIEAAADAWVKQAQLPGLPRVAAFTVMVHSLIGMISSLWCYFWTDFPPPLIPPTARHPYGPGALRWMDYSLAFVSSLLPLAAVIVRVEDGKQPNSSAHPFGAIITVIFVGLLIALPWTALASFLNPHLVTERAVPVAGIAAFPWWYVTIALQAVVYGIIGCLSLLAFRAAWRFTAPVK